MPMAMSFPLVTRSPSSSPWT
ncbi:UNVERIFIED_CONTAM: hypothetical protein GTU68_052072 [Idotea baltica]|nr:hypothetical protein [Idotea baltica]